MKLKKLTLSFLLVLLTLCIYWQTGDHGFCLLDDGEYVADNNVVLKGITAEGISWAFSSFHAGNWHPVTWLSHMLDVQLFGSNASGHHLVNVLFHAVNAVLVFFLFTRLTSALWRSFAVALLFAVHPLHVESVAWIAERKDLLSGFFFLLTLAAWERYVRRQSPCRYLCALTLFALGLMSKPMLVTLPFILLLLDWWPLGRFGSHSSPARLFVEKIPFILFSVASSVVTFLAQNHAGAVVSFTRTPSGLRLANAVVSYGVYIRKMLWPTGLGVYYAFPTTVPWWQPAVCGTLLVIASLVFLRLRASYPYLIFGWLWYLGMLIPVIGIIQVGGQSMADRYSYLPLMGPFVMIAWGAAEAATGTMRKIVITASAVIAAGLLAVCAWRQAGYWKSDIVLFSRTLEIAPDNNNFTRLNISNAYMMKGLEFKKQWKFDEALNYFAIAAARSTGPVAAKVHNNIGLILAMQGKDAEAVREYLISMEFDPTYSDPYYNLGLLYLEKGRSRDAANLFAETVRLNPEDEKSRRYLQDILR